MSAKYTEGTDLTAVKHSFRQQCAKEIKELRNESKKAKKDFIDNKIFLSEYLNTLEKSYRAISALRELIHSYWPKH